MTPSSDASSIPPSASTEGSPLHQFMRFFETSRARESMPPESFEELYQAYDDLKEQNLSLNDFFIPERDDLYHPLSSYLILKAQQGLSESAALEVIEAAIKLGLSANAYSIFYVDNHEQEFEHTPSIATAIQLGCSAIIELLLQQGADPVTAKDHGVTLLHLAATRPGSTEIIQLLLEYKAPIDSINAYGEPPLHWALRYGDSEAARLLLESGANPYLLNNDRNNSLHQSVSGGHLDLCDLLIHQYGFDINALNDEHETPLHLSCYNKSPEIASFLMAHGADLSLQDKNGQRAFDLARLIGNGSGKSPTTDFFQGAELALKEHQSLAEVLITLSPATDLATTSLKPLSKRL